MKRYKKIFMAIAIALLAFVAFIVFRLIDQTSKPQQIELSYKAYDVFIQSPINGSAYALYDIDNNGVSELLYCDWIFATYPIWAIYTIIDNELVLLKEDSWGQCSFYSNGEGTIIISGYGRNGIHLNYLEIADGSLIDDIELHYIDNIDFAPDWEVSGEEYRINGNLVSKNEYNQIKSQYFNEPYSIDIPITIFAE